MATEQTGGTAAALAPDGGIQQQATRAVPWTVLGYITSKGLSWVSTVILAHILVPADFGLIAIAGLVIGAISVFTYVGLGSAVVLEHDLDQDELAAGLGFLGAVGFAGAIAGALLAPLVALAFDVPGSTGVVAAASSILAFAGISGFYYGLLQRELRAKSLFLGQVVQGTSSLAVSVSLAVAGAGVWSLVAGNLAASVGYMLWVVSVAPVRLRPRWDPATVRRFWRTGKGFLAHNTLWWAATNADYAVVGRVSGTGSLGAYSTAFRLVEVPNLAIADAVAQVSFPSFARLHSRGVDVIRPYLRVLGLVAFAACPLAMLLSATAHPLVHTLLGSKWNEAIGPLALLGLMGIVLPLSTTEGWLLKSTGRPMTTAKVHGATLAVFLGPLIAAAIAWGVTAVAAVMLVRELVVTAAFAVALRRKDLVGVLDQLGAVGAVVAGCAAGWLCARGLIAALHAPSIVELAVAGVAGLAVYLIVVRVLDAPLFSRVRSQASAAVRRTAGAASAEPPPAPVQR
jgi:lipopolysaccharide exporter